MKRRAIIFTLLMIFSVVGLCACNNDDPAPTDQSAQATQPPEAYLEQLGAFAEASWVCADGILDLEAQTFDAVDSFQITKVEGENENTQIHSQQGRAIFLRCSATICRV